jgi:hypothetical protein
MSGFSVLETMDYGHEDEIIFYEVTKELLVSMMSRSSLAISEKLFQMKMPFIKSN